MAAPAELTAGRRPFTVHDLFEMPDDGFRYEVVDGCVDHVPGPGLAASVHRRQRLLRLPQRRSAGDVRAHRRTDGSDVADVVGTILEAAPRRLVMTFNSPGEEPLEGPSTVTFEIEPHDEIVRLTVTHENLASQEDLHAISDGWSAVLANLKSLLETGHALSQAPWEMHADVRAARMAKHDPR